MPRRFTIHVGHAEASAVLHDDAAEIADQFWASLPIGGECHHVRWSGECGYLNHASLLAEGPIRYRPISLYFPGAIAIRPYWGELAFAYGQAQARDEFTTGTVATHLATVDAGLAGYLATLAGMRRTGEVTISMTRAE